KTKDERPKLRPSSSVLRLWSLEVVANSAAAAAGVWLGGELRADGRAGGVAGSAAFSGAAGANHRVGVWAGGLAEQTTKNKEQKSELCFVLCRLFFVLDFVLAALWRDPAVLPAAYAAGGDSA